MVRQRESNQTVVATRPAEPDTRSRILTAAEELLRRHGPERMTVVDVARHLGMSHANVYKHFTSKAQLRDAVVELWLERITGELGPIAKAGASAEQRIRRWIHTLVKIKIAKVHDDPKMFRTYNTLAESARGAVEHHISSMLSQLSSIVKDGVARGEWKVRDPQAVAKALLNGTSRFHHPHLLIGTIPAKAELDNTLDLLIAGLRSGAL